MQSVFLAYFCNYSKVESVISLCEEIWLAIIAPLNYMMGYAG